MLKSARTGYLRFHNYVVLYVCTYFDRGHYHSCGLRLRRRRFLFDRKYPMETPSARRYLRKRDNFLACPAGRERERDRDHAIPQPLCNLAVRPTGVGLIIIRCDLVIDMRLRYQSVAWTRWCVRQCVERRDSRL